jgi:hypothetical protein
MYWLLCYKRLYVMNLVLQEIFCRISDFSNGGLASVSLTYLEYLCISFRTPTL